MPEGSSSAAPLTSPGPRILKNPRMPALRAPMACPFGVAAGFMDDRRKMSPRRRHGLLLFGCVHPKARLGSIALNKRRGLIVAPAGRPVAAEYRPAFAAIGAETTYSPTSLLSTRKPVSRSAVHG